MHRINFMFSICHNCFVNFLDRFEKNPDIKHASGSKHTRTIAYVLFLFLGRELLPSYQKCGVGICFPVIVYSQCCWPLLKHHTQICCCCLILVFTFNVMTELTIFGFGFIFFIAANLLLICARLFQWTT